MAEPALDDLSMEEILSSIRRIITHDEGDAQESGAGGDETTETKRSTSSSASTQSSPTQASSAQASSAQASSAQASSAQASSAQAPPAPSSTPTQASAESSARASSAQSSPISASPLSDRLEEVERRLHSGRGVLEGVEGKIEAYAESVLRPILAQWVKEHLPALLDRVMREEIEKAVKRLRK